MCSVKYMKMATCEKAYLLGLTAITFSLISGDFNLRESFNKSDSSRIPLILTTWGYRDAVHTGKYYNLFVNKRG